MESGHRDRFDFMSLCPDIVHLLSHQCNESKSFLNNVLVFSHKMIRGIRKNKVCLPKYVYFFTDFLLAFLVKYFYLLQPPEILQNKQLEKQKVCFGKTPQNSCLLS